MINNFNIDSSITDISPIIIFTEESMAKLLTAYSSLRDLEKLLALIAGIDPSNKLLYNLRHIKNIIKSLSPLYNPNLDYNQQVYTKILDDDSLSIPVKAHFLLGTREENGLAGTKSESSAYDFIKKCANMPICTPQRTSVFTVENMVNLLKAYYGYIYFSEALNLLFGTIPCHKILYGLSHLGDLLSDLSPLYHFEYDDDDIENDKYLRVLESWDIGLMEKAKLLMGEQLQQFNSSPLCKWKV